MLNKWTIIGLVLTVSVFSSSALAEGGPCQADVKKFCSNVKQGGGRVQACLKQHQAELLPACAEKTAGKGGNFPQAMQACGDDAKKFCKDVPPGQGRKFACLKEHKKKLSAGCAKELKDAKD